MNIVWLILVFTTSVHSFGYIGHRIIGRLVWTIISSDTRDKLIEHFGGKSEFLQLSSWPDRIKFDVAWKWTFKYHFVNSQDDPPNYCTLDPDNEDENLLTAVEMFYNNLNKTDNRFVENLSFLIHLIGDLHQPLHITAKDHGGTRHYLQFMGRRVPLHLFYDTLMIKNMLHGKSEEEFALLLIKESSQYLPSSYTQCDDSIKMCALEWAQEANMVNCKVVFREDALLEEHEHAVKSQLLLAAHRIAHVLPRVLHC